MAAEDYVEYASGLNTRKSYRLYKRAEKLMPGGASSHGQWPWELAPPGISFSARL